MVSYFAQLNSDCCSTQLLTTDRVYAVSFLKVSYTRYELKGKILIANLYTVALASLFLLFLFSVFVLVFTMTCNILDSQNCER